MKYRTSPEPCRVCGGVSYVFDEHGAVHLCCSRLPAGETVCPACRASAAAEREWQSGGKQRAAHRAKQAALLDSQTGR